MNTATPRASPVVVGLIAACLLVFLLQLGQQAFLLTHFALWPPGERITQMSAQGPWQYPPFQIWQLASYALLHGGVLHLMLNLFGLWMFGTPVERVLGSRRFAVFFAVCVVGAGVAQILAAGASERIVPTIGASGGVLGLLPAFAILFPRARIQLLFPPVNLRAPVFVVLFGGVELLFGVTNTLPGIAHFAHLGGMLTGGVLLAWWLLRRR